MCSGGCLPGFESCLSYLLLCNLLGQVTFSPCGHLPFLHGRDNNRTYYVAVVRIKGASICLARSTRSIRDNGDSLLSSFTSDEQGLCLACL